MPDILEDLTDAQKEAVTHINGPVLVIAGPGSGKTRVITRRIAYLMYCGIRPWNILAITFTNKAASEMRSRVEALVGEKGAWLSTFHAYCARVLHEFADRVGYRKDFTIYDSDDSLKVVQEMLREMEVSKDRLHPRAAQSVISVAKGRLLSPEEFAAEASDPVSGIISKVYAGYDERLRAANAMDFDDLLMKAAFLLQRDADALEKLRQRHQFVSIDEFQDTSRSQYVIARMLTSEHRNICVTGDPDQSIYGWRGADITNILDFQKDFPEAKLVFLDRNYRSTSTILAAANNLVRSNVQRMERTLYTENPAGDKIRLVQCRDSREEGQAIAATAKTLLAGGHTPRQIAVFYRINALSREIEEAFVQEALPYQVVGGIEFYSRREVKDILAYLRVAANRDDRASIHRVINVPSRGIGGKSVELLDALARERRMTLFETLVSDEAKATLPPRTAAAVKSFTDIVSRITAAGEKGASAAVETAVEASGYRRMLEASGDKDDKDRIDNLQELTNAAAQYDQANDNNGMAGFLELTALAGDIDEWHDREDRIALMTMHAAKGLEFPAVILAGLDEGILPHSNSSTSTRELEEERRVFFVAMTRAKEKLYLFHSDERMVHGGWRYSMPSRFLREIPPELMQVEIPERIGQRAAHTARAERAPREKAQQEITSAAVGPGVPRPGTKVTHREFGDGVVKSVTPQGRWHKITVSFQGLGEKKLIFEMAGLEICH